MDELSCDHGCNATNWNRLESLRTFVSVRHARLPLQHDKAARALKWGYQSPRTPGAATAWQRRVFYANFGKLFFARSMPHPFQGQHAG